MVFVLSQQSNKQKVYEND